MDRLQIIAEETTLEINKILVSPLSSEQQKKVERIVEHAVIKSLLEGQHRAVDAAICCPDADQDLAHKIASEIRRKNDALIVNISSLR